MYKQVVIFLYAAAVVLGHDVQVTTPIPIKTAAPASTRVPEITSHSSPAPPNEVIAKTYLPVHIGSKEVKIGSNYNKHPSAKSIGSIYVPNVRHPVYQPVVSSSFGHYTGSTTQATPIYTTSTPAYSISPVDYQSRSSVAKSYPSVASYVKSTIAPTYSYSFDPTPVSQSGSYPSHVNTYGHQPISHYSGIPTVAPTPYDVSQSAYSTYPSQSFVSYPSSTPAPSLVSSTLEYDSSSPLAYSVSPTVSSYSTPPAYSIQAAPLRGPFSYAVPSLVSYLLNQVPYTDEQYIQNGVLPYHGGHGAVQFISGPRYSSYSPQHGGVPYSSVPVLSYLNYNAHGLNYNSW